MAEPDATAVVELDQPRGTLQGVMDDLVLISRELPVDGKRAEAVANTLDQLAVELREAAHAVRNSR